MATTGVENVILAIIIGTLAAIVYSMRILVLMERKLARMDINIELMAKKTFKEEINIEREEKKIENKLAKRKK